MSDEVLKQFVSELRFSLARKDFIVDDKDNYILESEIKRAIRQINRCRRFEPTDEKPYDKKYEDLIIPLAISAFAKIGAEGETVHSENGITRHYTNGGDYPADMLNEIIPLIK